jgi:hypothetical protein
MNGTDGNASADNIYYVSEAEVLNVRLPDDNSNIGVTEANTSGVSDNPPQINEFIEMSESPDDPNDTEFYSESRMPSDIHLSQTVIVVNPDDIEFSETRSRPNESMNIRLSQSVIVNDPNDTEFFLQSMMPLNIPLSQIDEWESVSLYYNDTSL